MSDRVDLDAAFQAWSAELQNLPSSQLLTTHCRQRHAGSSENALLAGELNNAGCVPHVVSYLVAEAEVRMLFALGPGVHGMAGICHGGFICLMLDEATGQLAAERFGRYSILTAALAVAYKHPLATPAVVCCRVWRPAAQDASTKKVTLKARLEDRAGVVYATAEATFVNLKHRL